MGQHKSYVQIKRLMFFPFFLSTNLHYFNFSIKISIAAFFLFLLAGCSTTERFTKEEEEDREEEFYFDIETPVRLLIDESYLLHEFIVESPCYLYVNNNRTALIQKGNKVTFNSSFSNFNLQIRDKVYNGSLFELKPYKGENSISYKGKTIKGGVKVFNSNNSVQIVNTVDLEEYLKGVLPKEMPLGKGNEYFEALKASAVCARTYTLMRMKNNSGNFDLYIDVRDQVYGGSEVQRSISDLAVDDTKGQVLTFNGEPATIFYHSTCGGRTEDVRNIFTQNSQSYLRGVIDGDSPYCSISPAFSWSETYPENIIVERLFNAGLISDKNFSITKVEIRSRFESGRVNELQVELSSGNKNETVLLKGNNIRSILRTADNKGILKSIWFDISFNNYEVTIEGKGYGHGVGLCQWGALYQSKSGVNYKDILQYYFPGIQISKLND